MQVRRQQQTSSKAKMDCTPQSCRCKPGGMCVSRTSWSLRPDITTQMTGKKKSWLDFGIRQQPHSKRLLCKRLQYHLMNEGIQLWPSPMFVHSRVASDSEDDLLEPLDLAERIEVIVLLDATLVAIPSNHGLLEARQRRCCFRRRPAQAKDTFGRGLCGPSLAAVGVGRDGLWAVGCHGPYALSWCNHTEACAAHQWHACTHATHTHAHPRL